MVKKMAAQKDQLQTKRGNWPSVLCHFLCAREENRMWKRRAHIQQCKVQQTSSFQLPCRISTERQCWKNVTSNFPRKWAFAVKSLEDWGWRHITRTHFARTEFRTLRVAFRHGSPRPPIPCQHKTGHEMTSQVCLSFLRMLLLAHGPLVLLQMRAAMVESRGGKCHLSFSVSRQEMTRHAISWGAVAVRVAAFFLNFFSLTFPGINIFRPFHDTFVPSLPLKKAWSGIGADRGSGLRRPLLPPPTASQVTNQDVTCPPPPAWRMAASEVPSFFAKSPVYFLSFLLCVALSPSLFWFSSPWFPSITGLSKKVSGLVY